MLGLIGVAIAWAALSRDCQSFECSALVQSAQWTWGIGAAIWAMSWWSRWPAHALAGAAVGFSAALATLLTA